MTARASTVPMLAVALSMAALGPVAAGYHTPCWPSHADPSSYTTLILAGEKYYLEERDNPFNTNPPAPGSGFLVEDPNYQPHQPNVGLYLAYLLWTAQDLAGGNPDAAASHAQWIVEYALANDLTVENAMRYVDDLNHVFLGGGTWLYKETNGLYHNLERGGGLLGDPVADETCGHGPDLLVMGAKAP